MTRRQFVAVTALAYREEVVVPVRLVLDGKVKWRPEQIEWFRSVLWAQAVGELMRCGVRLQVSEGPGEVARPPERQPVISGLDLRALNFVLTNQIPMQWDGGRSLCGITTLYRGHHMCMVAYNRAHAHQIPFLSVNTCLHELLHALLNDIFEGRPNGVMGEMRETRVDLVATRLWLFGDGAAVRAGARAYLERLRI